MDRKFDFPHVLPLPVRQQCFQGAAAALRLLAAEVFANLRPPDLERQIAQIQEMAMILKGG